MTQAKRMKAGPKRAKKRMESRAARSPTIYSRKSFTAPIKTPSGKTFGHFKAKPTKRHGSFPTSWSASFDFKSDPLGQQG